MAGHVPSVTHANRLQASIDDYFREAAWIWARDASERSVFDLWLHVVDHCSRLVEAVRKESGQEVMGHLSDTVMWLLQFVAQMHNSRNSIDAVFKTSTLPSDMIWNKFPGICPACLDFDIVHFLAITPGQNAREVLRRRREDIKSYLIQRVQTTTDPVPCQCLSRIVFAEDRHKLYRAIEHDLNDLRLNYAEAARKAGRKASSMSQLEQMFSRLFGHTYRVLSTETIAFHLLEEVGEVSEAVKDCYTFDSNREPFSGEALARRKRRLEEEIADVFSWIHALMLKIRRVYYEDAQNYFQMMLSDQELMVVRLDLVRAVTLPDVIWAKFGKDSDGQRMDGLCCSGCHAAPCQCRRDLKIDWSSFARQSSAQP